MKTKSIIFASVLCLAISSCSKTKVDPTVPVAQVEISPASMEMTIGEKKSLSAKISPSNATDTKVLWATSSSSVASVSDAGEVTANSSGTAIITASCGSVTGSCTITVLDPFIPVSSIAVEPSSIRIPVGRTFELSVTVDPDDATDKTVIWKSDNTDVATVEDGIITTIGEGFATVTAIAGEKQASCLLTVIEQSPSASEVWYTSWMEKVISPNKEKPFGSADIVSNTYEDGKGTIVLASVPKEVSDEAFRGAADLKSISLPDGIKSIGQRSFESCSSMNSIVLQEGLETICDYAFQRCTALKSIDLPWTLKSIGRYSFGYCLGIEEITIPEDVSSIGEFAFYSCKALKRIVLKGDTPPELGFRAFDETGDCDIVVPASAIEKYKKADRWSSYSSRIKAL